jgi:hypothetical protein
MRTGLFPSTHDLPPDLAGLAGMESGAEGDAGSTKATQGEKSAALGIAASLSDIGHRFPIRQDT